MMSKLATLSVMKKMLLPGVFAAALATVLGMNATGVSAEGRSRLWSVAVHIEYADGFVYENVFASGVPTEIMPSILADCGHSHWTGSVVRYHCFPIPE
jgi:hypothetical protein